MAEKKETIKQQEDRIRALLQTHVHRVINREHDAFVDFLEIMMAQSQWLDKLDTIQAFKITRSRLNKALSLQVRVGTRAKYYTVSWRKGGSRRRKEQDPLQSAFRQAIHRQIQQWRDVSKPGTCVECEDTDHLHKKLQVDHKEPQFLQLTRDFLTKPINQNPPTSFDYHYKTKGKKFKKKDNRFKQRWQNYHRKNAVLQWLCRDCNLKKAKVKKN
jgi:hypothetical protein